MYWLNGKNARYSRYKNHEKKVKIQAIMYIVNFRCVWANIFAVEKSITYPEFVFVALGIQHTIYMCHIVTYGMPSSTIFFHIIC
jgi:hypothetical protein